MLADSTAFMKIEASLIEDGMIEKFEKETGKLRGRMMIVRAEVPKDLKDKITVGEGDVPFEATFDFIDTAIGIVIDTKGLKDKSGFWLRAQTDNPKEPPKELAEFFIQTLVKHASPNGSIPTPIFSFITENGDYTVVPKFDKD